MGIPVLILGESGSGKSASLRNFQPEEVGIINVEGKPLPFRSQLKVYDCDQYYDIKLEDGSTGVGIYTTVKGSKKKSIVIDDVQYLMANEYMRRSGENGYQKFTDIGKNFWELVRLVPALDKNTIVYFLGHIERDQDGHEKFKTIGKLLDEKITVEGMFTIVLRAQVKDGTYTFRTQSNGLDTVKSPMGMFHTLEIDNDLKLVDETIRSYYGLEKNNGE